MVATRTAQTNLREQYDRVGYVVVKGAIDADLVEETRQHVAWLMDRNPGMRPEQLGHTLMGNDPFWVRLISDERLLDIAEQFVGPNIALFASHYIAKPPHDGQPVLWHQDGSFWPLEPMEVVSLWLAADDSTPENGCMRVIPGSQTLDLKELRRRADVTSVLGADTDEKYFDESTAADIVLAAGDVSVHHPNIVHGSAANTSDRWRRGLTIRYIPTTTRILTKTEEPWPSSFLLRGQAVPGVNVYLPRPRYVEGQHMPFRGSAAWA